MSTLLANGKVDSGVIIDHSVLQDFFSPRTVLPFTPPPTGIDNLGITSTDRFHIPGVGDYVVDFSGYVRVARSKPTAADWVNAEVYTNLIEMRMVGRSPEIGEIIVTLNPDYLSTGMLRTPFESMCEEMPDKACRMAVGAIFTVPKLNLKLYNKEPIELTIDQVKAIPPSGNPGVGRIYRMLPLFRTESGGSGERPTAFLTGLDFAMGTYLSPAELEGLRRPQANA